MLRNKEQLHFILKVSAFIFLLSLAGTWLVPAGSKFAEALTVMAMVSAIPLFLLGAAAKARFYSTEHRELSNINPPVEIEYLARANEHETAALIAADNTDFERAYEELQNMKDAYINMIAEKPYIWSDQSDQRALLSNADKVFAQILSLEGQKKEALMHSIYWLVCSEASNEEKWNAFSVYFEQCEFKGIKNKAAYERATKTHPDRDHIKQLVLSWH